MERILNIQWFPGHMNKTRKLLSENLKLVDIVIEMLDARIPRSSKNPEIDQIIGGKKRIIVLNKSDLSDSKISKEWVIHYKAKGILCVLTDSASGRGINQVLMCIREMMAEKIEYEKQKGRIFKPVRTMVVGIPNVGKSSFINRIAGKKSAVTGDKPGVTRGSQWIRLNREIQLLDTPGILWPKFEDIGIGLNLAYTGAIKDEIIDTTGIAAALMEDLARLYPENVKQRYKIEEIEGKTGEELLESAGRKRGCVVSGGIIDLNRIASIVLDEFRGGKIGKMSLEKPV
jgi:ribosome biogenesis GTPase A